MIIIYIIAYLLVGILSTALLINSSSPHKENLIERVNDEWTEETFMSMLCILLWPMIIIFFILTGTRYIFDAPFYILRYYHLKKNKKPAFKKSKTLDKEEEIREGLVKPEETTTVPYNAHLPLDVYNDAMEKYMKRNPWAFDYGMQNWNSDFHLDNRKATIKI